MSKPRRIIAIDPGDETGWAIGRIIKQDSMTVEAYGHDPWKIFAMTYMNVMQGNDPFEIVVYESWRLRAQAAKQLTGTDFPAVQCVGAIKVGAWQSGAVLVTSEPAHKPVVDKWMGGTDYLPDRGGVEHHRDALRHLYWYAINPQYGGVPLDAITNDV